MERLKVGDAIISRRGEQARDEQDELRHAPPGSEGHVVHVQQTDGAQRRIYAVVFPEYHVAVYIDERDLADEDAYVTLPQDNALWKQRGFHAQRKGVSLQGNPYPKTSEAANNWREGWRQALLPWHATAGTLRPRDGQVLVLLDEEGVQARTATYNAETDSVINDVDGLYGESLTEWYLWTVSPFDGRFK